MNKLFPVSAGVFFMLSSTVIAAGEPPYKMGYKPTPPSVAQKYLLKPPTYKNSELPKAVDLCDKLPPVGDQGRQGSCVAWAVGYYYKTFQEGKEHGWDVSDPAHICSPAFIYNQINSGHDYGSIPYDAFLLLSREGCASLASMPYSDSDYMTLPTKEQMLDALSWRADYFGYFYFANNDCSYNNCRREVPLTDEDINNLKALLANGEVFTVAIPVFYSFFNVNETNYFYDGPYDNDDYAGGHMLVVCGYDDEIGDGKGGFKIRNSWGTSWGNKGEAYLSYDFIKNYSFEAVAMVDRIGYSWKVVADIDIDNLYRSDAFIRFSNCDPSHCEGNVSTFTFMGDYIWQLIAYYIDDFGDYRQGIHAIVDLTDVGVLPLYEAFFADLNLTSKSAENVGILSKLILKTDDGRTSTFEGVPVEITGRSEGGMIIEVSGFTVGIEEFKAQPSSGYYPLDVTFYYSVSGDVLACEFDFDGDGQVDKVVNNCSSGSVEYTYEKAGEYTAVLKVSDGNESVTKSVKITVLNASPEIKDFRAVPEEGYYPLDVAFNYAVEDRNGDVLACEFDFDGDGQVDKVVNNCSSGSVEYTYEKAGEYTAVLKVSDGNESVTKSVKITVLQDENNTQDEGDTGNNGEVGDSTNETVNYVSETGDGGGCSMSTASSSAGGILNLLVILLPLIGIKRRSE